MASLSTATDGELTEFKGRLARAGFSAEILREVNRSDDNSLATSMYEAVMRHPRFALIHGIFNKPEDQLKRVRELNLERGWGFTDACFIEAEKSIPKWPDGELVAVTLVPYLKDGRGMKGAERTFQELWAVAAKEQHAGYRWDGYDKAGPDKLRLLKGIEHTPGLRWEVIDLGCNRNEKPMVVRSPEKSPHAGILASAMLHPEWIKSMDGVNAPYVWAPGYEVNVTSGAPWRSVPRVYFDRDDRRLRLDCDWCGDGGYGSRWSVPSFVRE